MMRNWLLAVLLGICAITFLAADAEARYYQPTMGRWVQRDPVGYTDGMNNYGYVGGKPCTAVDPSGLIVSRGEITDLPGFATGGGTYIYTCACGWLDRSHITGWGNMYANLRNAVDVAIRGNRSASVVEHYDSPPRDTYVHFRVNPTGTVNGQSQRATPADVENITPGMGHFLMAEGEANQIHWWEESLFGWLHDGFHSSFSLEDMPTNWVGLNIAAQHVEAGQRIPLQIDLATEVTAMCGPAISKAQALCVFDNMTEQEKMQKNTTVFPILYDGREPRWYGSLRKCSSWSQSPVFLKVSAARAAFNAFVSVEREVIIPGGGFINSMPAQLW